MSVMLDGESLGAPRNDLVCWTRMQSEAGQRLQDIIARKELERRSGDGLFFWGVGNPPAVATPTFARLQVPIVAVFSLMKSRPKPVDASPESLLVWRKYTDMHGFERELPENVLVTSRGNTETGSKKRHYALMCHSAVPLRLKHGIGFDPSAYRNAGTVGAPVGASQVTALLQRVRQSSQPSYEVNLSAQLVGSYWVKLSDPIGVSQHTAARLNNIGSSLDEWLDLVSEFRKSERSGRDSASEPRLFY